MGATQGPRDRGQGRLVQALEACEARFRNIIERNADGVVVVRPNGRICFVNPAATRLLARSSEALLGRPFGIPIDAGDANEIDIVAGEGELRVAGLRVVETEWEREPALLISLRDITAQKRLEEQLREQAEALAEADRRKDEFLAMLAHELRNPLAPILNAAHVMRQQCDNAAVLERMREIVERQVRSLARLVDDLLDVSRITRGKIQLRKEEIDLSAIVQRSVETTRPFLVSRDQSLGLSLPGTQVRLLADPLRLEQIFTNILNNAAKYSEPGSPIHLEAITEGPEAVIRVRDHGIGMAPETVASAFDLFVQADRSLARSQGGLGIGLTLVRSLVHLHDGTVTCQSEGAGRGSEFVVRLPILDGEPKEAAGTSTESAKVGNRPLRILVIDDNVQSAESLALILSFWGHETQMAHSGPEALERAGRFLPEAVLLDIGLPGMDGHTVARTLRTLPGLETILLVAITGYGRDDDRQRSFESGFNHHLVKPLDIDQLESLLGGADPSRSL